jgi:hypothetical protein
MQMLIPAWRVTFWLRHPARTDDTTKAELRCSDSGIGELVECLRFSGATRIILEREAPNG